MSSTPDSLIVVNTSPLLYLHQVECIDVLFKLYSQITVPTAVQEELEAGRVRGIDTPVLSALDWVQIKPATSDSAIPNVIDLGRGEAEVIAIGLAYPGSLLILDDQLGRRIASFYKQNYTGTLGVLIKAKQSGYLASIASVIRQLQNQGMWVTEPIIQNALRLAGEL